MLHEMSQRNKQEQAEHDLQALHRDEKWVQIEKNEFINK